MKKSAKKPPQDKLKHVPPWRMLQLALACAAAVVAYLVYRPALGGGFVFDDRYLPFLAPGAGNWPLGLWIGLTRPVLMLSFYAHLHLLGLEPYSYHAANFALHVVNSALVFVVFRRLLERAGEDSSRNTLLAGFGAAVFLLHPLQTESVSYVASRSEVLSAAFLLGALAVFLTRHAEAISLPAAAAILAMFGAAALTKEHTAILPLVFLAADYWWNPGFSLAGIKRNWRLYIPVALVCGLGLAFVWNVLRISQTAGFRVRGVAWHDYFLTECRVIWTYLRMYVLPYGQNVDPDVRLSRSLFDQGAAIGLIGLAALALAAWIWRKREPLATFGFFLFLILLAPTSSFIPILDPQAERRMYLPMAGLILVTIALIRRWRAGHWTMAGVLGAIVALAALVTYQRNQVWAGPIPLWADTAAKSPARVRPRFQLAFAYYEAGRCAEASREFEAASKLDRPGFDLLVDWGLALDCTGQYQPAVSRLEQAAGLEPGAHVYALLGMVHGKNGNHDAALTALAQAERIDPRYDMIFAYRGNVHLGANELERAEAEFRRALSLNPSNPMALEGLRVAQQRLRAPR